MPSINVAVKITDALGTTLNYLVKDEKYEQIDENTLKRLKDIQELSSENKRYVFALFKCFYKTR